MMGLLKMGAIFTKGGLKALHFLVNNVIKNKSVILQNKIFELNVN